MAIDNPNIAAYKPFYIQKEGAVEAFDTLTAYSLVAKSNPYKLLPKAKDPYKVEWAGENGVEEYTTQMFYEPFEFDVQFYVRATGNTAAADIRNALVEFFNVVKNGDFRVYDSYTAIGRRGVRYVSYEDISFSINNNVARHIFKVTFKCNEPTIFCVYDNNPESDTYCQIIDLE